MEQTEVKGGMGMAHADKKKRKGAGAALFALGAAVLLSAFAGLSARYVSRRTSVSTASANRFYFTSDLLDKTGAAYTLSPETSELTIELRNYGDELRWSGMDISYSYSVKKAGTEVENGTGVIQKRADAGSASRITLTNLSSGTYEVTAVSESPFSDILTGTFTIPESGSEIHYQVSDSVGSAQALLTVYTDNYSGNVIVYWPENVIPDSTQEAFAGVQEWNGSTYGSGSVTVTVAPYSSYTYRFIKTDSSVDYSGGTAIKAAAD